VPPAQVGFGEPLGPATPSSLRWSLRGSGLPSPLCLALPSPSLLPRQRRRPCSFVMGCQAKLRPPLPGLAWAVTALEVGGASPFFPCRPALPCQHHRCGPSPCLTLPPPPTLACLGLHLAYGACGLLRLTGGACCLRELHLCEMTRASPDSPLLRLCPPPPSSSPLPSSMPRQAADWAVGVQIAPLLASSAVLLLVRNRMPVTLRGGGGELGN
jgi:hypothetical protein